MADVAHDRQPELLAELTRRLIQSDPPSYERAMNRYLDHDCRFGQEGPVREHYFATLDRVLGRLRQSPEEAAELLGAVSAEELQALTSALQRISAARPCGEEPFRQLELLPELVMLLAQRLGIFREDYLRFIETLPPRGGYSPRYMNFGPSGRCNLRCRDCILWGALFQGHRAHGVPLDRLLEQLEEAEKLGVHGLSFCIGEPTVDLPYLDRVLDRVRCSEKLYARSFVTNGLFGRKPERAQAVWQRILTHLGPEKTARCVFAISANPHLEEQGVLTEHTVVAIAAFGQVMPNPLLIVQLIREDGYWTTQDRLLELLVQQGLLDEVPATTDPTNVLRLVKLKSGLELLFSVMAKMPAVNSSDGERLDDPWLFYLDPDALDSQPMPGLFMRMNADPLEEGSPQTSQRIALGPDGQYYADYHFMVRQVRPLGSSLGQALESFGKDPILTRLENVGGLNEVLAAYHALPPEQRPINDLRSWVGRYSTVSMVAANVLFGDEDLALRLARALAEQKMP